MISAILAASGANASATALSSVARSEFRGALALGYSSVGLDRGDALNGFAGQRRERPVRRHQCLGDAALLVSASRGSRIGRRFRVTSIVTHIVARTFTLELRGGALAFALFAVEFDRAGVVLLHSGPYRRGRRTRFAWSS